MYFRCFDADGKQLTADQLKSMRIATPEMEHIFAAVTERIEKNWKQADKLENHAPEEYN